MCSVRIIIEIFDLLSIHKEPDCGDSQVKLNLFYAYFLTVGFGYLPY